MMSQRELLEANWQLAFHSFDFDRRPDLDAVQSLSDTQLDYVLVCVGARRSSFWDGQDMVYSHDQARRYPTRQAATDESVRLANAGRMLWKYMRLVAQPKKEMGLQDYWPEDLGYHRFQWVMNDRTWKDPDNPPAVGTRLDVDGTEFEVIRHFGEGQVVELSNGRCLLFAKGYGLCRMT